jgi:succinoglycan biosynthesis transport protein ExoP
MDSAKLGQVTSLTPAEPQTLDMPRPYIGYPDPIMAPQGSTLGDYWRILQKRRWTVVLTTLFVLTVVTIASFRAVPLYEASARIAISKEDDNGIRVNDQAPEPDFTYDYNIELDTQAKILQSDTLALAVMDTLQLNKNPRFVPPPKNASAQVLSNLHADPVREAQLLGIWHENLSVNKIQRTRMIEIRYFSPDPKLAAQIVNTLASGYIENNFKSRFDATMQASEWLSKQLSDLQIKVETSQEALVKFQKENAIVGFDEKQNTELAKLNDLNHEATNAEADRVMKQASYQNAASGNLDAIPELSANPLIQDFRRQEGDLQRQLAQASIQFGPSYPKVLDLKNQLAQVQASIKSEVDRIVARKNNEFLAARSREGLLTSAFNTQKQSVADLNEKAITYLRLKQEADSNRQLYDGLQQKLKEAVVTSGLRSTNVHQVDVARPAVKPSKPNIPRNVGLGFILGLLGGVALAFVLESLDNTVRTPDQVEVIAGLPSLGIIPLSLQVAAKSSAKPSTTVAIARIPSGRLNDISIISHARPKSEIAESYRALRTSILLSSSGSAPQVIMMTSALPQDGKTTTSINTAIVLAQKGGKVLLVDADLRRPGVHHGLKIRNRVGLSTLLTGSSQLEDVITPSPMLPNLFVIPSGPPPPQPAELLGSAVMKHYIEQWRTQYDHIIIDTPPVLSVTDAVLLSVDVDAVVLVIRSAKTTKEALRRSRELLGQVNAKVMGVVVNAIDLHSPDAYYYYYGANYSGRYYDESAGRDR